MLNDECGMPNAEFALNRMHRAITAVRVRTLSAFVIRHSAFGILSTMDQVFQPPAVTLFDAVTSTIAAVSYLAVGLAAIARAPRDERARVFLAVALTSAVAYAGPGLQYWKGIPIISRPVVVPTLVAMAIGGVALFH